MPSRTTFAVAIPLALAAGCTRAHAQTPPPDTHVAPAQPPTAASAPRTTPGQLDPDGNDDPVDVGTGTIPTTGHFERVGRPPLALHRICDLRAHGDALYAAHANEPLGSDGATLTRYRPDAPHPFTVAFDWNRPGMPASGGGAGQGFVRIHEIGGRLFVPDADPPYAGFCIADCATEGYVFISDADGNFAPARGPRLHPPASPTPDGRAGAAVLPRAYHDLDVIRYRGRLYASTGSVPPHERAWYGPSPGALHVANATWSRWTYEVDYPYPWQNGVWRLTYMVRFRDRLYAGIQDYDWREPNDFVYFDPPRDSTAIRHEDMHPTRVTDAGGAQTLRWWTDRGRLYWLALEHGGATRLRVTDDGDHWSVIELPTDGGRAVGITRFRDGIVVLAENALYRLDGERVTEIARVTDRRSPFELTDIFCAPPLAVYRNALYLGGQRGGVLYRLADGAEPAPSAAP